MKIKSVRARVFEWKGKTVPPQGNFCSNAMDLLYSPAETMSTFRFHSWTVVEIETDDGIIGIGSGGNYAMAAAKALYDIPGLSLEDIARKAMQIAGDIDIYTNHNVIIEKA